VRTARVDLELVVDAHALVGEGPIWDARSGRLVWIDIIGSKVHWYSPSDGRATELPTPKRVGSVAPRSSGGLVVALEDGFWLLEADDKTLRRFVGLPGASPDQVTPAGLVEFPPIWLTDGKCDPGGAFWAGSVVGDGHAGGGILWRLDGHGQLTPAIKEMHVSSSLGWSPDGRTFYYADAQARWLDAFGFDQATGAIGDRRRLIEWPSGVGVPDGMAVDADGFLWIAMFPAGSVNRYAPDGRLDRSIELPVPTVAACAFGGPDLEELYITTMYIGVADDELARRSGAGGLFRCRPGVRGLPVSPFAG
jgi:sugar lactone lactonase YvrE